jgi:hypothetical protein
MSQPEDNQEISQYDPSRHLDVNNISKQTGNPKKHIERGRKKTEK